MKILEDPWKQHNPNVPDVLDDKTIDGPESLINELLLTIIDPVP
jgi:hypothetical protein